MAEKCVLLWPPGFDPVIAVEFGDDVRYSLRPDVRPELLFVSVCMITAFNQMFFGDPE